MEVESRVKVDRDDTPCYAIHGDPGPGFVAANDGSTFAELLCGFASNSTQIGAVDKACHRSNQRNQDKVYDFLQQCLEVSARVLYDHGEDRGPLERVFQEVCKENWSAFYGLFKAMEIGFLPSSILEHAARTGEWIGPSVDEACEAVQSYVKTYTYKASPPEKPRWLEDAEELVQAARQSAGGSAGMRTLEAERKVKPVTAVNGEKFYAVAENDYLLLEMLWTLFSKQELNDMRQMCKEGRYMKRLKAQLGVVNVGGA